MRTRITHYAEVWGFTQGENAYGQRGDMGGTWKRKIYVYCAPYRHKPYDARDLLWHTERRFYISVRCVYIERSL